MEFYRITYDVLLLLVAIVVALFFVLGWNIIFFFFNSLKKEDKKVPHSDKFTKFVVLVPARNEGKVVHRIIASFNKQTYPREYFDVIFIVEDINDPTVQLALDNGYSYFVRPKIAPDRHTKGFALQECIADLNERGVKYDAYMIFDADNILSPEYIERMNDLRQSGVQVGTGYRNFINAKYNIVTSSSAVLLSYINRITSQARSNCFSKFTLTGTGYFIDCDIIDAIGIWKFTGMTEDTELTRYCYRHNVKMKQLYEPAYYDEQPIKIKTWHNQHIRWIWGYLNKPKDDIPEPDIDYGGTPKKWRKLSLYEYKCSFIPFAILMVGLFLIALVSIGFGIGALAQGSTWDNELLVLGESLLLVLIFISGFIATAVLIRENSRMRIGYIQSILCVLSFWYLYFDILLAFFDGLFNKKKRTTWTSIPHGAKATNKKAKRITDE